MSSDFCSICDSSIPDANEYEHYISVKDGALSELVGGDAFCVCNSCRESLLKTISAWWDMRADGKGLGLLEKIKELENDLVEMQDQRDCLLDKE